jgi:hypothetical protein
MYGDKTQPEKLSIVGPKGQMIPNAKINLEYFVSKEQFQSMLYVENMKYAEIISRIDFPYDAANFSRIVRGLGWKKEKGKVNRFRVNESFFSNWTKESAWVFGWLITDGHINNKYTDLTLQKSDRDVIDKVKELLEFTGDKYVRENKETLRIYNRALSQSLFDSGIPKKNKTFDCEMPNIPDEFMWDFIRGAFEGDGSISTSNNSLQVSICGASKNLMIGIRDFLNSQGINTTVYNKTGDFWVIRPSGMGNALKWLFNMYQNTNIGIRLDRKFNKYIGFLDSFYSVPRKVPSAPELVEIARSTFPECA